jgi:hypothetical protein
MNVSDIKSKISDTSTRYSSRSSISNDSDESNVKFPEIAVDLNKMLPPLYEEFMSLQTRQQELDKICASYALSEPESLEKESQVRSLGVKIERVKTEIATIDRNIKHYLDDIGKGKIVQDRGTYPSLFENLCDESGKANFYKIGEAADRWVQPVKAFLTTIEAEYAEIKQQLEEMSPREVEGNLELSRLEGVLSQLKIQDERCTAQERIVDSKISKLEAKIRESQKPAWRYSEVIGVLNKIKTLFEDIGRILYWYLKVKSALATLKVERDSLRESQFTEGRQVRQEIEKISEQEKSHKEKLRKLSSDIQKLQEQFKKSKKIIDSLPNLLKEVEDTANILIKATVDETPVKFELPYFDQKVALARVMIDAQTEVLTVLQSLKKLMSQVVSLDGRFDPTIIAGDKMRFEDGVVADYRYVQARLDLDPGFIEDYTHKLGVIEKYSQSRKEHEIELAKLEKTYNPIAQEVQERRDNLSELPKVNKSLLAQERLIKIIDKAELFIEMNHIQRKAFVERAYAEHREKFEQGGYGFVNDEFIKHNFAISILRAMPEIQEPAKYYEIIMKALDVNPEESQYCSSFYSVRDLSLWENEISSIVKKYKSEVVANAVNTKLAELKISEKDSADRRAEETLKMLLRLQGEYFVVLQSETDKKLNISTKPGYSFLPNFENSMKSIDGWVSSFHALKNRYKSHEALIDKTLGLFIDQVRFVMAQKSVEKFEEHLNKLLLQIVPVFNKLQITILETSTKKIDHNKTYEDMRKLIAA